MIFTLLGYVIDGLNRGDEKIVNDNETVSIVISDRSIIKNFVSPLCDNHINDKDIVVLNFRENLINHRCELYSITFGRWTCEVSNNILDEVAELSINELYHTMCERIML